MQSHDAIVSRGGRRVARWTHYALVCAVGVACRDAGSKRPASDTGAQVAAAAPSPQIAATGSTSGKPVCPATGVWSECGVFERLDHAGLAPRRDSAAGTVALPPLTARGTRLLLGN